MLLDRSHQFDLSRLLASKPCDQLDVQLWGARDATSEEGTSGLGMDPGYASKVVDPQALTETPPDRRGSRDPDCAGMEASETTANKHRKALRWDPKSPLRYRPLSEYAEVRVLRVARRAIQQFC